MQSDRVDQPPAHPDRHRHRGGDQIGAQVLINGLPDHPPRTAVPDRAQIQPALTRSQVGDVGGPHPIQRAGVEPAPHQVSRHRCIQVDDRCAGANVRGLIPASRCRRSDAATVLRDTRSPAARRSASTRGAPYTPSEPACDAATLASSAARRRCKGWGRGRDPPATGRTPTVTPQAARTSVTPCKWPSPPRSPGRPLPVLLGDEEGRG